MKRVRSSAIHSIRALAIYIGFCLLVPDASAQPANESPNAKPLEICIQALTDARRRVDALRPPTCSLERAGESVERLQRERDGAVIEREDAVREREGAVRALALILQMRIGLPQGCGETIINISFAGSRPAVEVRGSAHRPEDATRRIDDAIRDLGLDRASVDISPADACGRRLSSNYVVLTDEAGDQPLTAEKLSADEIERLPDVEACEDVGQLLVDANVRPFRFWVRRPGSQLAQCFRRGNRGFTWVDINTFSEPALIIQRGAQ